MEKINGSYMERMCLESSMSGLNLAMKTLILPFFSSLFLVGLGSFYTSENLNWGYSNPKTKDKICSFYNTKKELNLLKNSKNKLLAKCSFPFYSELSLEDFQTLNNFDNKISLLDKHKFEIKEDILKNDEQLYANYSAGKFCGSYMSLAAIVGFLLSLRNYRNQKRDIIKEAKETRAYWDSISK